MIRTLLTTAPSDSPIARLFGAAVSFGRLRHLAPALCAIFLALSCGVTASLAQSFVAQWTATGGMSPTGVALATEAGVTYLYVSDHLGGRIVKFNAATGAVAATLGTPGAGNGQFNRPYGLAIDRASGDLYVAERGNHRVQRITNTGTFVTAWGGQGAAAGQFNEPIGVALDAAGDVYVTEHTNHRVQKFRVSQSGGTWTTANLAMWGTQGSANGQFNIPYGIAIDASGNVLVADGFNGRVQRFSAAGVYQATIGGSGTGPGQFIVATSVTTDASGAIYVTSTNSDPTNAAAGDVANQWISKFSAAGAFQSRWGGAFGSATGQFRLPFFMAIGADNRAYVSDYYNNRIQVFDLAGAPTPPPPPPGGGSADTTPPTVASFNVASATASNVTFALTFNESVTGVNSTDFTAVTTGGATATIGAVAGSGAAYTIPVAITGTGTVRLNLNASGTGIADASGNAIAAGASGPTHTIGSTPPTTPPPTTPPPSTPPPTQPPPPPPSGQGTRIIGVTVPANGTYTDGQSLTFTVTFSGNVIVRGDRDDDGDDDDGDRDDKGDKKDDKKDGKDDKKNEGKGSSGGSGITGGNSSTTGTTSNRGGDDDDDDGAFFTWSAVLTTGVNGDDGKVHYVSGSGSSTLTFLYKVKKHDGAPAGIRLGTSLVGTVRDAGRNRIPAANLVLPWAQNPLTGVILDGEKSSQGKDDRIVNLSSRLRVIGGDANRSVFAGFVVTGTAPKLVLLRAVGPGLRSFGIRDALDAPRLELRDSTGKLLAGNDGWGNRAEIAAATDRVGAFKLGHGSKDAALLLALAPGAYTAQVTANGNGTMLLEIYDASTLTQLSAEQIVNISTRGFVDSSDDPLIAGFVIAGKGSKRVLIRGVGPGLNRFGLTGTLANPVLKLHRPGSDAPIAQNDDWQTPQPISATQAVATAAEISAATLATGAFPLAAGSKDAAILVTLPPGSYSAVVSGAANGTGAGLVEVYEIPTP